MVAEAPNVVISCLTERRKVVVRLVRGRQNLIRFVADQEDILPLHSIAIVAKGYKRTVFREARFRICFSPCRQQRATIARRNLTGFPDQRHRLGRQAHAPPFRHRHNAVQGRPAWGEQRVVRNGVHLKCAVSQPFHVEGGSKEHLQHLPGLGIHNGQTCGRIRRVTLVCEPNDGRSDVRAEHCVDGVVQRQVTPFTRKRVGRSGAEGLHHKGLVKRHTAVRNARQSV